MSMVIIGGHDRMVRQYKQICKEHQCKVKVFTQMSANMREQIRSLTKWYVLPYLRQAMPILSDVTPAVAMHCRKSSKILKEPKKHRFKY